jgi:hypothetical protein
VASPRIDLESEEVDAARRLAEATYERFRSEAGHYRNLPRSHLIGKLAELAVEKWLRAAGLDPDPAFRDPDRVGESDVVVHAAGIEVKCWRPETWAEWGRCVTPGQIRTIKRKSEAVIWAIVDDEASPIHVDIVGWNTPEEIGATDVRATGPDYRPVMNHQVAVDALRDPDELLSRLREASKTS